MCVSVCSPGFSVFWSLLFPSDDSELMLKNLNIMSYNNQYILVN